VPLLEVTDLSSGYGRVPILHDVSLRVQERETVCLLGANGAGKTTLAKTIAGMIKPSHGRILLEGADITGQSPARLAHTGLSLVLQGRSVFPFMTVDENLDMGAYVTRPGPAADERRERVFQLFPRLKERRTQVAGSMSGGEQKMLEIGRSLMMPLKLLVLDEPSLGLAPRLLETIFDRVRELNQAGMAVLLIEQNAIAALTISDRAYVLELGRVTVEDSAATLLANPEIKAHYLGTA
jgi:branched-chain amino acid transport system ATP-binding protein